MQARIVRWAAVVLTFGLLPAGATRAAEGCPPTGWSVEQLRTLESTQFTLDDAARRKQLALGLLGCLGSPDPALRDRIAFEAWSAWLRGNRLDQATRTAAIERLLPRIAPDAPAGAGFDAPFAALVLSEIARTDRVSPWMTPAARERLLAAGTAYVASVRDYRGFDPREGWRHGVAHGADLLLQLALNPALDKPQLDRLFAALAVQVAPTGHAYVYGEPERLARPLVYGALRGLHTEADWQAWFGALATPGRAASWREAVGTPEGLARRHDLRAFLLAVHAQIAEEQRPALAAMRPAVREALKRVP
jgi:hypothetical protein